MAKPVLCTISVSKNTPVPPKKLWSILGDFSGKGFVDVCGIPPETASYEGGVNVVGAKRSTTMYNDGSINNRVTEELTSYNPEKMELEYRKTEFGPLPMISYSHCCTISAEPSDGTSNCKVSMVCAYVLRSAGVRHTENENEMPSEGEPPYATRKGCETWISQQYESRINEAVKLCSDEHE